MEKGNGGKGTFALEFEWLAEEQHVHGAREQMEIRSCHGGRGFVGSGMEHDGGLGGEASVRGDVKDW